MSGVFISHSSQDKPFVRNLAAALLAEGIPVWLDSWELHVGDPLLSRIESGIKDGALFIVVVSRSSVESGWVERELRTALVHESKAGRKFVFPIKVDECNTPEFMAERVFADFRIGFSYPFSILVSALEKGGARELLPRAHEEIVSLSFTNETNVNQAQILNNVKWFQKRHPSTNLEPKQIKVVDDEDYVRLKLRLHARIDQVHKDKWWSPEFELGLKRIPEQIRSEEGILARGVAELVNSDAGFTQLSESLHWFLRLVRSRLCYSLYRSQNPDSDPIAYGKECGAAWGPYSKDDIAKFYGVEDMIQVDAWSTKYYPTYESLYIGVEQLRDDEYRTRGSIPYAGGLEQFCRNDAFFKYVLPQALYWGLSRDEYKGVWRQEDVIIGPH